MAASPLLLIAVVIYGVPLGLGMVLILQFMRRCFGLDLLFYSLAPICTWLALIWHSDKGKTLSNLTAEPLSLAVMLCILILIHCIMEKRGSLIAKSLEVVSPVTFVLLALGVYCLWPALSE